MPYLVMISNKVTVVFSYNHTLEAMVMSTLSFYTKSVNSTHPVASHSFKRIFELCFKLPERSTQCANSLNAAFTCAKYCKRVSAHHTHTHTLKRKENLFLFLALFDFSIFFKLLIGLILLQILR